MNNLPNDIYIQIYKNVFNNVLIELKLTLNGIQKKHNNKLLLYNNLQSKWCIPIKSFQNQHIYNNIETMEYSDYYIYNNDLYEFEINKTILYIEINGNCWKDLYEAADELIKRSGDTSLNKIKGFKINKNKLKLITSESFFNCFINYIFLLFIFLLLCNPFFVYFCF